jgi:hypothetical protein
MSQPDLVPAGRYEVVVAAAEDKTTRNEHYMRRLTLVVVSRVPSPYVGTVLYCYAVDHKPAEFVWQEACEHPRDLDVRQRYLAEVIKDRSLNGGQENRVVKLMLKPGNDKPTTRKLGCEHCNGGNGDPHAEGCPDSPTPEEPARRIRRESASRRSAVEREQERIEETVWEFLFEMSAPEPNVWPTVGGSLGQTGVVFPDSGIEGGAILMPGYARQLGAHLIRAADLHDEIQESGR